MIHKHRFLQFGRSKLWIGIAIVLTCSSVALGVSIHINTPANGVIYARGATIAVAGWFDWAMGEPTVDMVELQTNSKGNQMAPGNVVYSDAWASVTKTINQDGSGSGTFQSQNNTIFAPSTGGTNFFVSATPMNAARGAYFSPPQPINWQNLVYSYKTESTQ